MHIGEIITADSANGEGIRVSIFVSGCTNHCKGCFQPQTWDYNYGYLYDDEMEEDIIKATMMELPFLEENRLN